MINATTTPYYFMCTFMQEAVQSLQSDNSQLEEQKKELQKEIAGLVFTVTTQKDVLRERLVRSFIYY